jgi:outer membrane protein
VRQKSSTRFATRPLVLGTGVSLLVCSGWACANDLDDLYRLARSRDADLTTAGFQRDAAKEAQPQAIAQLLPHISAGSSAERERLGYDNARLGPGAIQNCALSVDATSERCYATTRGLSVTLSQTLWNTEAYNLAREARSQVSAAEATWRGAEENLLLRVAQTYFAILAASDQLATNRREREAFGTLLAQAKGRMETGVGPRSDVEQAQAFYDATEQSVIDAQNLLDDAHLALTQIVGSHRDDLAPLRENFPLVSPEPASADDWVVAARQDNFDVRAAMFKVEAAARDIWAQRGKSLPTLSLTGSSSRLWQDDPLGGNQRLDTLSINLNWPLFQSGAVASAVRQSRALYREAESQLDAVQRLTERQTRAAFRDVVSGIARITAARRAVESGRNAVEASRRNVEFGTGTEFDLLNAQNNYYAAQRAYDQVRYDYLTSLLTLKQQAGRLTEPDLVEVDALLVVRP